MVKVFEILSRWFNPVMGGLEDEFVQEEIAPDPHDSVTGQLGYEKPYRLPNGLHVLGEMVSKSGEPHGEGGAKHCRHPKDGDLRLHLVVGVVFPDVELVGEVVGHREQARRDQNGGRVGPVVHPSWKPTGFGVEMRHPMKELDERLT